MATAMCRLGDWNAELRHAPAGQKAAECERYTVGDNLISLLKTCDIKRWRLRQAAFEPVKTANEPHLLNPDSEVGEIRMEQTCLRTGSYIVKIQLRRSWICVMELIENKAFLPKFHRTSVSPLFSTLEFGLNRPPSKMASIFSQCVHFS
jgi:hypothetical protein